MFRFRTCLLAVGLLIALAGSSHAQWFAGGGWGPGGLGQQWGGYGGAWGYGYSPYYATPSPYGYYGNSAYGFYPAYDLNYGFYSPPLTGNNMGGLMQGIQGATGKRWNWRY
jgi:hypothetical protein